MRAWAQKLQNLLSTKAAYSVAVAEASEMMKQGKSAYESVARGGVNLAVELVIGGIPITAAAHAASLVIFELPF